MSVWLSHALVHLASLLEGLLEGSLSFASRNIFALYISGTPRQEINSVELINL